MAARTASFLIAALAFVGLSCSSTPTNAFPGDVFLSGVGGSGPNDVWIVGESSSAWHWDGVVWSKSTVGAKELDLSSVWVAGPSDAWAVGDSGVFHWNGSSWSPYVITPSNIFHDVWGSSANDVWAVGDTIAHWDGATWSTVRTHTESWETSFAVWGSSPNDVWALGTRGPNSALHWDGASWSATSFPDAPLDVYPWALTGVSGTGADDVWAVGGGGDAHFESGTLAHWDGRTWTATDRGGFQHTAIWGTSHADVWSLGGTSEIYHYDGATWALGTIGIDVFLSKIWGSGPRDVWAVGDRGTIMHWDGDNWTVTHQAP